MSARTLHVTINDTQVGRLSEQSGVWQFTYSEDWLSASERFPLSPHLPLSSTPLTDGGSVRPVQWYFDNLLPEEHQRQLLASDASIDHADAFGLLAWYGAESAGSLTLTMDASSEPGCGLRPLSDKALSSRIRALPRASLNQGAAKRMSLAGAQHKLAVVLQAGQLFEPVGHEPSTHILKPDHPGDDYPHSVANEWFTMRLALRVGLDVPKVLRRYVPEPVYLIERFDRQACANASGIRRTHTIDACQLLGLDRGFKYVQGSIETLGKISAACRAPAVVRSKLFAWLLFNVITGNSDAHLKNLSFRVSAQGIALAPFYDLLAIACYDSPAFDQQRWPSDTRLAWPILGTSRFAEVTRDTLLDAAATLGIRVPTARRVLEDLLVRITREADDLYQETLLENQQLIQLRPALAPVLAGEARCLRSIVHTVILPTTQRLTS